MTNEFENFPATEKHSPSQLDLRPTISVRSRVLRQRSRCKGLATRKSWSECAVSERELDPRSNKQAEVGNRIGVCVLLCLSMIEFDGS